MKQTTFILILILAAPLAHADELASLKPLMNVADKVVYQSTFSQRGNIDKSSWQARQGTQWQIAGGVLRGEQSTPEYQSKREHHKGFEPRIKSLKTPRQFIARFSVRFIDGDETKLIPLIEFGHHNIRLKFSQTGVRLLADHESVLLAETTDVKLESGKWYHIMAERNRDEFVVQFAGGPTLYARDNSIAIPVADDTDGLGIAGARKGFVEIDNVTLSSIRRGQAESWATTRQRMPKTEPRRLETKKKTKSRT